MAWSQLFSTLTARVFSDPARIPQMLLIANEALTPNDPHLSIWLRFLAGMGHL